MSSRELFGTDGVRGLAGQYPLDGDGTRRIGMAVGARFAQPGHLVVIGCDTRESSAQIVADLIAGLNAVGVNVVSAGVLPTPAISYLTREHPEFVAGVMVTASHNTYEYNGIKVFDDNGDKLSDEAETELNKLIEDGVPGRGQGTASQDEKLVGKYEDFLIGTAPGLNLTGLKLAVDTANGAASGIAERVFKRLGAEVTLLFDKPDGRNINEKCGATDTKALQKAVTEQRLDLGIALDGDADRVIMIDERGREVKGDYLLYLLAVVREADGVVATIMSNQGFELALQHKGIKLLRTDVGDRYVLEGLRQTGYKLGGEASGHIIFPLVLATGDGMLAAVQTARAIETSGKSLAEWCDEVQLLPQALVNIPLPDKSIIKRPDVVGFIEAQNEQLGEGRLLIRPSGTEPVARVMVEASDAQAKAEQIAAELRKLIKGGADHE
ncbi:MAG TPA: phosphoglucosamine mutase, partial [Candidatus Saccharimonadia bacterium]|nr:phosphoglucosamine mutase [Candidatus Saccharimonadia bacterium]